MNIENIKNRLKPIIYPIINFVPRRRLKTKNLLLFVIIAGQVKFIKNWEYPTKRHL